MDDLLLKQEDRTLEYRGWMSVPRPNGLAIQEPTSMDGKDQRTEWFQTHVVPPGIMSLSLLGAVPSSGATDSQGVASDLHRLEKTSFKFKRKSGS